MIPAQGSGRRPATEAHERQSDLLYKSFATWLLAISISHAAQARADIPKANPQQPFDGRTEKPMTLTNGDAWKIYDRYLEGWKATSDDQRRKIAAGVIAENAQYSTPRHTSGGRATMIEDMATFQKRFPGGHFDIGDVSAHDDVALLTWVLVQADGKVFARGHDQIRVSPDGKIASVITFAPSVTKP
jgi:hypothetical protein